MSPASIVRAGGREGSNTPELTDADVDSSMCVVGFVISLMMMPGVAPEKISTSPTVGDSTTGVHGQAADHLETPVADNTPAMTASAEDAKPQDGATATTVSSAWAPFRSPDFARMASAQFLSNVGSWMQTVGAQELMLTLTTSATLVALIQTAAGLPVVLLAIPAGAIGDLVDRRRLLIASQSFMLCSPPWLWPCWRSPGS
jgi:hypothetical protein